jgi:Uma2 family endonuclease
MGHQSTTGLTWSDLQRMPEDGKRREIIDGVLYMTPSPTTRHQLTVLKIGHALHDHAEATGGLALVAPLDVVLDARNVVEPDVLYFNPEHLDRIQDGYPRAAPDLAVEVSSPRTKGMDRIRKRALYERFGVAEYWIVDLDHDVIEAYVLRDGVYAAPAQFERGDVVHATAVPSFAAPFERLVPTGAP